MQNKINRLDLLLPKLLYWSFFFIIFLYFLLYANHIFIYQEKNSLFVFSADYLYDHLNQPGSLLKYLAGLISSFYYIQYAGAFIASAVILLTILSLSEIIKLIKGKETLFVPFFTGILMFWLQTNYRYMLYNNLGILLQLLLALVFIKYKRKYLPAILLPLWYFLNGGFSLILYGIYVIWLISLDIRKNFAAFLTIFIVATLTLITSGELLFFQPYLTLLIYPLAPAGNIADNIIFTILLALICFLPLYTKINVSTVTVLYSLFRIGRRDLLNRWVIIAEMVILIILLAVTAYYRYDRKSNDYFRAEKLFYDRQYEELIKFNLKNPTKNIITLYLNNIALCETGRLNDMLFSFPQSPDGSTLFIKWEAESGGELMRHGGNFYYTTGMINEAYRWAFEYMVLRGYTPEGLRMMIKCEIINGNYKNAEIFINLLKKTIFYRKSAIEFERLLNNDEAVLKHPELGQKRRIRPKVDFFTLTDDPAINVLRVAATDSTFSNRNAWQYKIAWYLLQRDLNGVAEEWDNTGKYGFTKVPRHIQEAAVAMRTFLKIQLPDQGGIKISSEIERQYLQFLQTFQFSGSDLSKAEPLLRKNFGNTFWYYLFYK